MNQIKGYFSSNKKLVVRFSRMFWMETIFCLVVLTFSTVSQFYQQKQADETYGRWTAAYYGLSENDLSELKLNPLFETVGTQTIEGTLVQKKTQAVESSGSSEEVEIEQQFGSVGIADPSFFEMAGLKLKTGQLPQTENEIAMEATVLDGMGISYETGQPIELMIRKENPKDKEDFEEITKTYILSGVLENYSSTWSSNGNLIRSFISQPIVSKRIQNKKNIIAFIEPKKGYEEAVDTKPTVDRMVETNINRLLSRDPFSSGNMPITLCILLSFLFLTILQAETLFVWIWKRRQELRLLRIFGIHKKTLIQNVLAMLFKACRIPYLILLLALVVLIPIQNLPALILYIFLLQSLVLIAAAVLINQVPLLKKNPKKKKQKTKTVSKKITTQETLRRFLSQHKWIYRLQMLCLIGLQIGLLYFGNQIITSIGILNSRGIDYFLEGRPVSYQLKGESVSDSVTGITNDPIPAGILNNLHQWTDIEIVRTFRTIPTVKMSWNNIEESFLYNSKDKQGVVVNTWNIYENEDGQLFFYPRIWMINDPETIEQLKKADIKGTIDWENWKNGREAILYLPRFKITDSKESGKIGQALDGIIDSSIQPGDVVTLEKDDTQYEIPVSGILQNFDPHSLSFFGTPYDLILYGDEIDTAHINLKDIRNQVPVEMGLSKLAAENGLQFMNQASINEQARQALKTSIILNLFSALIVLSVLVMILQLSRITVKTETSQYQALLKRIGLPKRYGEKIAAGASGRLLAGTVLLEIVITFFYLYSLLHNGCGLNDLFKFGIYAGVVLIFVAAIAGYTFGIMDLKMNKRSKGSME